MDPVIDVTAAAIEQDGRILIAKRPAHKAFPGKWEFPGGKVEPSETPEDCLRREIKEEFDVDIEVGEPVLVWEFTYPNGKSFRFHSFQCKIASGELKLLAHEEMKWVDRDELTQADLLEADVILAEKLQNEEKAAG